MEIISFDVGESTGICKMIVKSMLFGAASKVKTRTVEIGKYITPEVLELMLWTADIVIVERFPGGIGYNQVNLLVKRSIPSTAKFVEISPGEWKPLAKVRKWASDISGTKHEKDAYSMIRFYLEKQSFSTKED